MFMLTDLFKKISRQNIRMIEVSDSEVDVHLKKNSNKNYRASLAFL